MQDVVYSLATLSYQFWLPFTISVVSLILAGVALWLNHLKPFKLEVTFNNPTFRLYVFKPPKKKLKKGEFYSKHIPSINTTISYTNTGSKPGKVSGLRFTLLKDETKKVKFDATWIVDYKSFNKNRHARFIWLDESVKSDWHPFFILPKQTHTQHIVFENFHRGEIKKGNYSITLEVKLDDSKKWKRIKNWSFTINDWVLQELEHGSSFSLPIDFNSPKLTDNNE